MTIRAIRYVRYMVVFAALGCGIYPASAQLRIVRQEQLEAVANPKLAPGAEVLQFSSQTIDLGQILEDAQPATATFVAENSGSKPLVITRVNTSCSCLSVQYDRQPIAAGGRLELKVLYHQKGHPGVIDRKLFVYTQLSEAAPTAILSLTGSVEQGSSRVLDYPHPMGSLRLRQTALHFDGELRRQQVQRIEFINTGSAAVTLTADTLLTPRWIAFRTEPTRVEAGETGNMVITLHADKLPETLPKSALVLYQGVSAAPAARTLKLFFDVKN